jgi:hypothetical protein
MRAALGEGFATEAMGKAVLKGFTQPIAVFALMATAPA